MPLPCVCLVCNLTCSTGYSPAQNCSVCVSINVCLAENPCQNGGTCITLETPSSFYCECLGNTHGEMCEGMHIYIYIYICMYVCVYVPAFMYACMYVCTYVSLHDVYLGCYIIYLKNQMLQWSSLQMASSLTGHLQLWLCYGHCPWLLLLQLLSSC